MNRRVAFFAVAALICFALIPVLDTKFHWVPKLIGGIYVLLTVLAGLDVLGRRRL
jgi:MFS-type transporter involved in bile tolerance (Atg22 family)